MCVRAYARVRECARLRVYVCVRAPMDACVCRKTEQMRKDAFQALAQQATRRSSAREAVGVGHGADGAFRTAPKGGALEKVSQKDVRSEESSEAFSGRMSRRLRADSLRRLAALVRYL